MDKLFLVSFLGLLITEYAVAGNMLYDNFNILGEPKKMQNFLRTHFGQANAVASILSFRNMFITGISKGMEHIMLYSEISFLGSSWTPYLVNATKFVGPCADTLAVQTITRVHTDWLIMVTLCVWNSGDDCISIVNAPFAIKMKRIYCGPGHRVSIGSLGKDNSTGIVTKVVLDTALLRETTNGVRIKTWQGGSGYVRGVRFENVRMEDVANPIIIDQFYCDSPKTCQNQTSAVEISQDKGFGYGIVHPSADCLNSQDKGDTLIDHKENAELAERTGDRIIHTEL
ncbi:hypothetical protein HRI_004990000 [Hibiscus trionum]|uniref:Polygalacturonase n=1 Tax=Hibiscus trionum TaxID=183268 RepID=A0A9W7MPT1_HIBTR|nr:hypothetical protein HRI_004990000 [Hibiscus trionum]